MHLTAPRLAALPWVRARRTRQAGPAIRGLSDLPRVRASLRRDTRTAAFAAGATMAGVFLVDALTLGEASLGRLLPNLTGSVLVMITIVALRGRARRHAHVAAFAIGMVGVGAALVPILDGPELRFLMLAYFALLVVSMAVFMPWDDRWHRTWVVAAWSCLVACALLPQAGGGSFVEQLVLIGLASSATSIVGHGVLHRRRLRTFAHELQLRELNRRARLDRLELRRLNTELLAASRADPLTRVGNRLRFDEDMRLLLSQSDGGLGALALLDVDHFKGYNDTFGHVAGDAVLRAIAEAVGRTVRPGDGVYRFGGEEFLVLLPGVDAAAATRELEHIREAVASLGIHHPKNATWGVVTLSAGLAMLDRDQGPDDWLRAADAALYRAKASGRNAVRRATPEDAAPD